MKKLICLVCILVMLLAAVTAMADGNERTSGLYTYQIKGNGTIEITKYNWAGSSGDIYVPNMIDGYVVSSIGDNAFNPQYDQGKQPYYTAKAVGVTLPDSVKSIGNFAFMDANLSSINIPASVQHIGDGAFVNCTSIQFKIKPNHSYFAEIDGALYQKQQKELIAASISKNITIPEQIVSIRNYALYESPVEFKMRRNGYIDCPSSITLSLPSTLNSIGDYAFAGRSLESESNLLPSNLVSIGVSAFQNCSLGSFVIPASVTNIGQRAFASVYNNRLLRDATITLPTNSQLTCIPVQAFFNIYHQVTIESSNITEVGSYAFAGLEYTGYTVKIDISANALGKIRNWGDYAFYCDTTRSKGTTLLKVPEQFTLSKDITALPAGFNLLIDIPEHVVEIKSNAYTDNVDVVDYYLPSTVKKIAVDAFPKGSTFVVDEGSYAELWCSENGFGYSIEGQDNLDWLNN